MRRMPVLVPLFRGFLMNSTAEQSNGLYPMRVVSRLTGLTADTIRVWERRYGAVDPARHAFPPRR